MSANPQVQPQTALDELVVDAERLATLLAAAHDRLDWLLDDYGADDVDYQTFAPLVALLDKAKAC